jgi:hypothetical protein
MFSYASTRLLHDLTVLHDFLPLKSGNHAIPVKRTLRPSNRNDWCFAFHDLSVIVLKYRSDAAVKTKHLLPISDRFRIMYYVLVVTACVV